MIDSVLFVWGKIIPILQVIETKRYYNVLAA